MNTSKSPLTAIVVLKKICDHPYLLQVQGYLAHKKPTPPRMTIGTWETAPPPRTAIGA